MLRRDQKIAVSRGGIDTGQHRRGSLEDLIVQAHANTRKVLILVDGARPPRGGLKHVVNGAHPTACVVAITAGLPLLAVSFSLFSNNRDFQLWLRPRK